MLPGGGVSERERDRVGRGWLPPLRTLSSARGLQVEAAKQAYNHQFATIHSHEIQFAVAAEYLMRSPLQAD